jgi:hypothetical protein
LIENLFLTYANNKFYEKIENLYIFYDAIISLIDLSLIKYNQKTLKIFIDNIIKYSNVNSLLEHISQINERFLIQVRSHTPEEEEWFTKEEMILEKIILSAFNSVYGFRGDYNEYLEVMNRNEMTDNDDIEHAEFRYQRCEACKSKFGEEIPNILYQKFKIQNGYQLRCYECKQFQFIDLLKNITETKGLNDILLRNDYIGKLFKGLADKAYKFFQIEIELLNRKIIKKYTFDDKTELWATQFNNILAYSLFEFLSKTDFNKLKQCRYCEKFFIAGDIRRQRCDSAECRKKYEKERKRIQRDNDPARYI